MTLKTHRKPRFLYLHGFASAPTSTKARFFRDRFAELGIQLHILELDGGDFEHLTITSQLAILERAAAGHPSVLIGSSLGGYLAALYASIHPEIDRVVLMAPAFGFPSRWPERLGPAGMAEWQRTGKLEIYHYGRGRPALLDYAFYEDGRRFPEVPGITQPALLFHGTRDDVVPADVSRIFAQRHPNAVLHLLDSGHELTDVLDRIWRVTSDFLGLMNPESRQTHPSFD